MYLKAHLDRWLDEANVLNVERGFNPLASDKPTPDITMLIEFARPIPFSASKLWGWYRLFWKGDFDTFLSEMVKAHNYSLMEDVDFETVALRKLELGG